VTKGVRLDRLLGNLGYGSRRDIAALANAGRITLDEMPLRDAATRVSMDADLSSRMIVNGAPIDPLPGVVLILNKPLGMTCSHNEAGPVVYDLLPERWRRRAPPLSTVGRLDKETSGLLLITDDGDFLHRVISPKRHVAKRYRVTLARPLTGQEGQAFASGALKLQGEDKPLLPAKLETKHETEAVVTITEGRYHQVRRMFAAVGNHVTALHRETIGGLALPDDLAPGEWRVATPPECASIFAEPAA
jgi:16S rRNA pseudouridine516 synthase